MVSPLAYPSFEREDEPSEPAIKGYTLQLPGGLEQAFLGHLLQQPLEDHLGREHAEIQLFRVEGTTGSAYRGHVIRNHPLDTASH